MKLNKITLIKILIVLVDIVFLTWFIVICFNWFNHKNNDIDVAEGMKTIIFKKFTYTVPNEIEYNVIDEDTFMFKTDDYEVTVMPFVADTDEDDIPLDVYVAGYDKYITAHGLNISLHNKTEIAGHTVYTYNNSVFKNSVICFYQPFSPFYYKLELFNSNDGYDIDALVQIIDILETADYDDESTELFEYYQSYEVFHDYDRYN